MSILQKDVIAERAMEMFTKQGIKAVRMDDIARSVGVSKRTLYEIFGDKEELVFQSLKLHFGKVVTRHRETIRTSDNILEGLFLVIQDVVAESETNWRVRNSLKRFYPAVSVRLENYNVEQRRAELKSKLEIGVKDGLLVDGVNLDLAITMLYYIASGVMDGADRIDLPKNISCVDAFREVVINFLRGISTPKGIEVIDNIANKFKNK